MSASSLAAEIRGGAWAGGLPRSPLGATACAEIPGIAGVVIAYVQPLRDWFDQLLGDSAQVGGVAAQWEDAAASLTELAPRLRVGRTALTDLDGRTVRALRERHDDLLAVTRDAAEWAAATAASLRLASRIVDATRTYVCEVLTRLARFAEQLFSFSLNPLEIAHRVTDFARAAADLVAATGRLVTELLEALHALSALIQRLIPIIAEAAAALKDVVARMLPAVGLATGGLVGMLLGGAAQNFLQKSADVEELDPDTLDPTRRQAWEDAQRVTRLDTFADLVAVNGTTDLMGGADATVIDVKRVVGADGSEHWVVSLPSTQDWQFSGDKGAINDRDSNIALMLDNPLLRSAYERAALEAMRDAGIRPGDQVVLTGFSQGGILAANLAADPTFPYRTIGVVTNGSPVDGFAVPADIPVYSFQHESDLVPRLDGNGTGPVPPNVHRITLPDTGNPLAAHDNQYYRDSIAAWEQLYAAQHGAPPPGLSALTGAVVDHSMFTAAE